jgi:hypothetical protein
VEAGGIERAKEQPKKPRRNAHFPAFSKCCISVFVPPIPSHSVSFRLVPGPFLDHRDETAVRGRVTCVRKKNNG